jgi:hypothetical protein
MKTNQENQVVVLDPEIKAQIFTIPNKAIVTEIVFTNGEKSQIFTAIPKGVLVDHIQLGVIQSLSMQNNILSCKSDVYYNCNGTIEMGMSFEIHFFNAENRKPSPLKQEYLYTSINYLN